MKANLTLLVNLSATWAMVGLIWLIQIVHYPLFAKVGDEQFQRYSEEHQRLITYVVLPLMFAELITACMLWNFRPAGVSAWMIVAGILLVVLIWGSTFTMQVPLHSQLSNGFEPQAHQHLVTSNWIRTIAWTARGLLTAHMAWCVMRHSN